MRNHQGDSVADTRMAQESEVPGAAHLLALIGRFETALAARAWSEIRELFHADSLIESVAAGGAAHGPDETLAAMARAARSGIYSLSKWNSEVVKPEVAIVHSRMRHRNVAGASITDEGLYWLMNLRDGLFWRIRIFHARADAVECLDEHGLGLGLGPALPA